MGIVENRYNKDMITHHNLDNTLQLLFWKYFIALSKIPRPSRYETAVGQWIIAYAKQWNYTYTKDDFGNIIVYIPASSEVLTKNPTIAIQSHLDMVCEKDTDCTHDFFNDALDLFIEEDEHKELWLRARGTTLGADNGIAVAYQLALMDMYAIHSNNDETMLIKQVVQQVVQHGALECVFTLDEETGLNGAKYLDTSKIRAEYLINIDNFYEGMCCVGCAGGEDYNATIGIERHDIATDDFLCIDVHLGGLAGGHSGGDIFDGRSSGLKLLEVLVSGIYAHADIEVHIIALSGGDKVNAIVREASCIILVHMHAVSDLQAYLCRMESDIKQGLIEIDKNFYIDYKKNADLMHEEHGIMSVISEMSLEKILAMMRLCPYGVLMKTSMESTGSKLSNNFSYLHTKRETVSFVCNYRFCNDMQYEYITHILNTVFQTGDRGEISITKEHYYPPWVEQKDSKLRECFIQAYKDITGNDASTQTLHVGIECGVILSNLQRPVDAICIGPNIEGAHSPSERLSISSAERVWHTLLSLCSA